MRERALQVGERHRLHVDVQPLDLMEVRGVRRVRRVAAVAAAGVDDPHGRLAPLHHADLDGRRLRAQQPAVLEPERVARVPRRVVRRGVERIEVVERRLHVRTVRDGEPELREDAGRLLDDAGDGVHRAEAAPRAGQAEIERLAGGRGGGRLVLLGADGLADGFAQGVEFAAHRGTVGRRRVLHLLHQRGHEPVPAEILDAQRLDVGGGLRRRDVGQGRGFRFDNFLYGHFRMISMTGIRMSGCTTGSCTVAKPSGVAFMPQLSAFSVTRTSLPSWRSWA